MAKPPTIVDLTWTGGLTFTGASGNHSVTLDSSGVAGPSPMQALGFAVAGCMAIDVAHILSRGRHEFRALRCHLVGDRSQHDPHRFERLTLHFMLEGNVSLEAVNRAAALSHEKYCSVWHSMRQDIEFNVSAAVQA